MKALLFLEQRNGQLKTGSFETLAAIKDLGLSEADVAGVLIGDQVKGLADQAKEHGVGQILVAEDSGLENYNVLNYASALQAAVETFQPDLVVGVASPMGRDLFPRLAARYNSGILTDLVSLSADGDVIKGVKPLYAGKCLGQVQAKTDNPVFVTIRPNVFQAEAKPASEAKVDTLDVSLPESRLKVKEVRKGQSQTADLTEASRIISGGRAMGSSDAFSILQDAAKALDATVGASRAAVDSGYAPHDMQVGQTGKTVNPNLYIACGISGSIQHMAGMRTSKVIVAINTDPEAPIFKIADYGIVGDLFEAVPILTKKVQELNG
jgi:electron transfer flavoprotein alpha subunit